MRFGVVGPAYTSRSLKFDCQRCINWYVETSESGGSQAPNALMPTPGLIQKSTFTSVHNGGCRGLYTTSTGRFFGVFGSDLFEFNLELTATNLGSLSTATGYCHFADNASNLMIVDGQKAYLLDLGANILTQPTSLVGGNGDIKPSWVTYLDDYYIFNNVGTNVFYAWTKEGSITDTFDSTLSWNAAMSPDYITAIIANFENIFVFGEDTIEIWYDSGNALSPLSRIVNAGSQIGCTAPHSIARGMNTLYFLGGNKNGHNSIFKTDGYNPVRISTHAIEYALNKMSDVSDAIGYFYVEEGHSFYVLSFPSGGKTFVWDDKEKIWHERAYWNKYTAQFEEQIGNAYAFYRGKNYVGSRSANIIYQTDLDTYTDAGDIIRRERIAPHLHAEMKWMFFGDMNVIFQSGIGNEVFLKQLSGQISLEYDNYIAGVGTKFLSEVSVGDQIAYYTSGQIKNVVTISDVLSDTELTITTFPSLSFENTIAWRYWDKSPTMIIQWSDDGANTWGNEHLVSMGKKGEYALRCRVSRLGYARDRVFKFVVSDPIKAVLIDADVEVRVVDS